MNPEQQRITIAEACRWTKISDWKAAGINGQHPTEPWTEVIPDYLNDLNAMHEAEESLHGRLDLWWNYMDTLEKVSVEFNPLGCGSQIHATATQRAEAFLKTIGKWRGAWK
jgi:hypothetical protein